MKEDSYKGKVNLLEEGKLIGWVSKEEGKKGNP